MYIFNKMLHEKIVFINGNIKLLNIVLPITLCYYINMKLVLLIGNEQLSIAKFKFGLSVMYTKILLS